jgi:hypothetical protein
VSQLVALLVAAALLAVVLVMAGSLVDDLRHPLPHDSAGDRAAAVALLVVSGVLALLVAGMAASALVGIAA